MGIELRLLPAFLLAGSFLLAAVIVFGRVRADYQAYGKLSTPVAVMQTGFFVVYAFSSYLFLDSRLTAISCRGVLCYAAVLLMAVGAVVVLLSMPFLGRRSFGEVTGVLHTSGIYHYSRNPQLVGGLLFIIGYALLWPSWAGLFWASIWLPVSWLMVRAEEEHLAKVFRDEYEKYRSQTPRYIGIPRRR